MVTVVHRASENTLKSIVELIYSTCDAGQKKISAPYITVDVFGADRVLPSEIDGHEMSFDTTKIACVIKRADKEVLLRLLTRQQEFRLPRIQFNKVTFYVGDLESKITLTEYELKIEYYKQEQHKMFLPLFENFQFDDIEFKIERSRAIDTSFPYYIR